jgi:hypothetical protein
VRVVVVVVTTRKRVRKSNVIRACWMASDGDGGSKSDGDRNGNGDIKGMVT